MKEREREREREKEREREREKERERKGKRERDILLALTSGARGLISPSTFIFFVIFLDITAPTRALVTAVPFCICCAGIAVATVAVTTGGRQNGHTPRVLYIIVSIQPLQKVRRQHQVATGSVREEKQIGHIEKAMVEEEEDEEECVWV